MGPRVSISRALYIVLALWLSALCLPSVLSWYRLYALCCFCALCRLYLQYAVSVHCVNFVLPVHRPSCHPQPSSLYWLCDCEHCEYCVHCPIVSHCVQCTLCRLCALCALFYRFALCALSWLPARPSVDGHSPVHCLPSEIRDGKLRQ